MPTRRAFLKVLGSIVGAVAVFKQILPSASRATCEGGVSSDGSAKLEFSGMPACRLTRWSLERIPIPTRAGMWSVILRGDVHVEDISLMKSAVVFAQSLNASRGWTLNGKPIRNATINLIERMNSGVVEQMCVRIHGTQVN